MYDSLLAFYGFKPLIQIFIRFSSNRINFLLHNFILLGYNKKRQKHTKIGVLPFMPSYATNYLQSNKHQVFFLN